MSEAENKDSKISKDISEAIFGSIKGKLSDLFPWTGDHKPKKAWLMEPLKNKTGDKIAKKFCTGCGMYGEATKVHLERIFKLFNAKEDLSKIDWSSKFLLVNACHFCIESAPEKFMAALVLGKLPKK